LASQSEHGAGRWVIHFTVWRNVYYSIWRSIDFAIWRLIYVSVWRDVYLAIRGAFDLSIRWALNLSVWRFINLSVRRIVYLPGWGSFFVFWRRYVHVVFQRISEQYPAMAVFFERIGNKRLSAGI
jgi:hypothetical protein